MTERERPDERQTVLLVDDEVLVRHELAEYLRDCGYRVIEAGTTDEAVTVLSGAPDHVDAVLCAVWEPDGKNGFTLARWVREHRPGLPVLLAGSPENAAEAAGELCKDGPALARPYDPALVVDRIRRRLSLRAADGGTRP